MNKIYLDQASTSFSQGTNLLHRQFYDYLAGSAVKCRTGEDTGQLILWRSRFLRQENSF